MSALLRLLAFMAGAFFGRCRYWWVTLVVLKLNISMGGRLICTECTGSNWMDSRTPAPSSRNNSLISPWLREA
ncbi:hypothetical protein BJ166DRAFT_532528 [Pestalotiopsis sp. NC0098]|nr:hypothetical protein BJ166DRAFT_532528 [Pestalotiopsis sp. NC0098]